MKISELTQAIEITIKDLKRFENGRASERILTIHNEVIFYLIGKGQLSMNDNKRKFYEFITQFNPIELYKVAEFHRKQQGKPPLNFQQDIYRMN